MGDLDGKIILVTGATSGIGKATVLGLAERGATVILHARDPQRGAETLKEIQTKTGNPKVELLLADLAVQSQIRQLVQVFQEKYPHLDVLINNAAIVPPTRNLTPDGIELQFAVNHLAYFMLANLLLDSLKASPQGRVVNVSSNIHYGVGLDFDNLQAEKSYGGTLGWIHYGRTKMMNVVFTVELARRLANTKITANAAHPGLINTRLGRTTPLFNLARIFFGKPQTGAETSIHVATSSEGGRVTGKYFAKSKITPHDPLADDPINGAKLWAISAELTGLEKTI